MILGAHKVTAKIKISNELLSDSIVDVESYVARRLARKFVNQAARRLTVGNGTTQAQGLISS